MAVMAAEVVEVFTAEVVEASVEASTAEVVASVEASTAVEVSAAPTVVDPTAAIAPEDEAVRCMGVVAATEAHADFRHRHVAQVQRALGPGRAEVAFGTPRLAGMRLQERATAWAWQGDPALEA
jgi:hypothetical protein